MNTASSQNWFARFWPLLLLLAVCWYHLVECFLSISPFDEIPYDGPFQLLNWIRRIDHGQLPGRDYNCFHGIGLPYLHYPLYKLLGGGVFALEFSRQFVCRFATIAVYLIISKLITKKYTLGIVWLSFGLLPGVYDLQIRALNALLDSTIMKVSESADPMYNSIGVRGLCPLLFLSCFYLADTLGVRIAKVILLTLSYLMGIEHGTALLLGVAVNVPVSFALSWKFPHLREVSMSLLWLFIWSCAALSGTLLLLLGIEGLNKFITFHYQYQFQDQTWYFGVAFVNYFLDGAGAYSLMMLAIFILQVIFGSLFYLYTMNRLVKNDAADSQRLLGMMVGIVYALLSLSPMLGYLSRLNMIAFQRVIILYLSVPLYKKLGNVCGRYPRVFQAAILLVLAAQIFYCGYLTKQCKTAHYSERFEKYLADCQIVLQEKNADPNRPLLWSTYSSIMEAQLELMHPTEWDYIIHALGKDRDKYCEQFQQLKPLYVQTLSSRNGIEEWLRTSTYRFYRELFGHYRVVKLTPFGIIWKRSSEEDAITEEPPLVFQDLDRSRFTIPAEYVGKDQSILAVEVTYKTQHALSFIPLLGKNPRFLVRAIGSRMKYEISLPPGERTHTFLVFPKPNKPVELEFVIRGLRYHAGITLEKMSVTRLNIPPELVTALRFEDNERPPRDDRLE